MGAVDELHPHQGIFGAEQLREDLIQLVPAEIVIAVAGGPGKIGLRHPVLLKSGQDLAGVLLRDGINAVELVPQPGLRLGCQGHYFFTNL